MSRGPTQTWPIRREDKQLRRVASPRNVLSPPPGRGPYLGFSGDPPDPVFDAREARTVPHIPNLPTRPREGDRLAGRLPAAHGKRGCAAQGAQLDVQHAVLDA